MAATKNTPQMTVLAASHGNTVLANFLTMHKSYNGVTNLSRSFAEQGWAMFHTVRMLFLTFAIIVYAFIHIGAKNAVENYEGYGEGYGHQHNRGSGLQNAPIRVPHHHW